MEERISVQLQMIGEIQLHNAAAALTALEMLFPGEDSDTWVQGFSHALLPGRMQVLSEAPLVVADGAHTPRSLDMAINNFIRLEQDENGILLFACGDDKNAEEMAAIACRSFRRIIITTPGFFKKSNPGKVKRFFDEIHDNVSLIENPIEAFKTITGSSPDSPVLVAGSFFLAGEIIKLYRKK